MSVGTVDIKMVVKLVIFGSDAGFWDFPIFVRFSNADDENRKNFEKFLQKIYKKLFEKFLQKFSKMFQKNLEKFLQKISKIRKYACKMMIMMMK